MLLRRFDSDWMAAQRAGKSAGGSGGAQPVNNAATTALKAACVSLAAQSGSVMLGLCAEDATAGVAALKAWTTALGLPRRLLHGMDTNGVANTIQGCVAPCSSSTRLHSACLTSHLQGGVHQVQLRLRRRLPQRLRRRLARRAVHARPAGRRVQVRLRLCPVAGSPSDPWGPHAHCRQFGYLPLSLMDSR